MDAKELGDQPAYAGAVDHVLIPSDGSRAQKIEYRTTGLTKRELFAAMALQGLLAGGASSDSSTLTIVAASAALADALLAELAKDQP